MVEHVDVLIVGAGLSGVSQAWHLQTMCPDRRYVILEARGAIGGTWDLFRYPGIRSDSDMHTLGFRFRPWRGDRAIAGGDAIRDYLVAAATDAGIDRHIRFNTAVRGADWSSESARWTVTADGTDGPVTITTDMLVLGTGYYDYDAGHAPAFAGSADFAGRIVHPQHWPADLDWRGRRVVVIGSGATAVTLIPELARDAASVTMLQRSPGYIVAHPSRDRVAGLLGRMLPGAVADRIARWKNIGLTLFFYRLARRWPRAIGRRLIRDAAKAAGPSVDAATDLTPRYDPWDQRVCLAPDGDLFAAIRSGRAAVVTGTIDRFTVGGIRLTSGAELPADLVVTATGLRLKIAGGIAIRIDGVPLSFAGRLQYQGMMFEGVPNFALIFGYTNASWTLKADLTSAWICRLLIEMRKRGMRQVMPVDDAPDTARIPFVDFTSGYIRRVAEHLPVQGARPPWRLHQNYLRDVIGLRFGRIGRNLVFSNPVGGEHRAGRG